MREWRDIHAQLVQILEEIGGFRLNEKAAGYDAIHRAVVSGLLSSIACKKEHNFFQAARGREVMIFPGSGLFQPKGKNRDQTPPWLVAAEMVETSRLFARTCARISSEWLVELGEHLCRASYKEPYWSPRAGRVLVRETLTLYGLEILSRSIPYRRLDPARATELFIREALMGDETSLPHPFLAHNRRLCHKLELWQTRVNSRTGPDLEQAMFDFYAQRLEDISSIHDLNRLVREKRPENPEFLFVQEEDLLGDQSPLYDRRIFPDDLRLDSEHLPLSYAYRPGGEDDGVTVKMPYKIVHAIQPEVLEWLVPGLLEEKITCLLRSLPKSLRKQLVPIPEKAQKIAAELRPTHTSFLASLEAFIQERYRLQIRRADWKVEELPDHLRMRVEVQGTEGQAVAVGRDLEELTAGLETHDTPAELEAWERAAKEWEQRGLKTWSFGDLPERVEVTAVAGVPIYGFPGIEADEDSVKVRLFKTREEAEKASRAGLIRLYEQTLEDELARLQRQLQELNEFKHLYRSLASPQELRASAFEHLEHYLFSRDELYPLTAAAFEEGREQAKSRLEGLALRFIEQMDDLLQIRADIRRCPHPYAGLEEDLERLMSRDFLRQVPFPQLPHLRRYLKAVLVRAERARLKPGKDREKALQVQAYQEKLDRLRQEDLPLSSPRQQQIEAFRWMVEEFRVSLFAQELGTAHPISTKRLDQKLEEIEHLE